MSIEDHGNEHTDSSDLEAGAIFLESRFCCGPVWLLSQRPGVVEPLTVESRPPKSSGSPHHPDAGGTPSATHPAFPYTRPGNPSLRHGWPADSLRERKAPDHWQVHADASNFAEGVAKEEAYEQVLQQAAGLFDGQRNWCVVSTTAESTCFV